MDTFEILKKEIENLELKAGKEEDRRSSRGKRWYCYDCGIKRSGEF